MSHYVKVTIVLIWLGMCMPLFDLNTKLKNHLTDKNSLSFFLRLYRYTLKYKI